jgi:hypothetical protein
LSEHRYTINGAMQWSATPGEIVSSMLDAMEGRLTYSGGLFQIWPAAYPYSVSGYDQNHPDTSIYNGCWQPTDAPEYACDALHGYGTDIYMAQDGGMKLPTDRRYQFVTSVSQAQRLSKIFLMRNRFQGTYTLSMNISAYQTRPVDVIQMTFPALNWTNKLLEVNTLKFIQNQQQSGGSGSGSPSLYVQLDVCETDPSVYAWSVAEELTQEARQSPAYWMASSVTDPSGLTLLSNATTAVVGSDGVYAPRILASWTQPTDPFTVTSGSMEVQWWFDDSPSIIHSSGTLTGNTTFYYITGCKQSEGCTVQIRASHLNGAVGNWIT